MAVQRSVMLVNLCVAGSGLIGCGGAQTARELEPIHVVGRSSGGETQAELITADDLFESAQAAISRGTSSVGCDEAATSVQRLTEEFPESRWLSPALYNLGLCYKNWNQNGAAYGHFQRLVMLRPQSQDVQDAQFQMLALAQVLERFGDLRTLAASLLQRDRLTADDRMEALSRRAFAELAMRENQLARATAEEALRYFRTRPAESQVTDLSFPAMANYVLAETIRQASEEIQITAGTPDQQHQMLDRRAALLLTAQREYFNTIRHTNAEWAAAAGYRIGSMYRALHQAIREAPVPSPTTAYSPEALQVFETTYRQALLHRIEPLMRHAIRFWELTLLMAERTGVDGQWVESTRADLGETQRLLEQSIP